MISISVLGAGLIGQNHSRLLRQLGWLHSIVDPAPQASALAQGLCVPHYPDLDTLLTHGGADGVVNATPNALHISTSMRLIEAGIPVLVEKPIGDFAADAARLVDVAAQRGVPLLVGHHRRYNPLIQRAKSLISEGRLGIMQSVHAHCWYFKPDDYFDVAWRRELGGGPILINLIHDIDLLRYLCGDIVEVYAVTANQARAHPVESSCVVTLVFANGTVGTLNLSDSVPAPWSWELSARENPAYPACDGFCYLIGGRDGSLSLPDLKLWHYGEQIPSWWNPISRQQFPFEFSDPLQLQLEHFAEVIAGRAQPLVSGAEGLATLKVIEAIKRSAAERRVVRLD
ncbi:MAG: Gfo/Idh/MocA family oxidoreductase [Gammaproteobacteria bacterium]|nr:Gfo/Idh/MocA family oxidoreductase [Gammaproteobacteria bacterium]